MTADNIPEVLGNDIQQDRRGRAGLVLWPWQCPQMAQTSAVEGHIACGGLKETLVAQTCSKR